MIKSLFSSSGDISMKRFLAIILIIAGIVFLFIHPDQPGSGGVMIGTGGGLMGVAAFTHS
jgi:hypothetical protein